MRSKLSLARYGNTQHERKEQREGSAQSRLCASLPVTYFGGKSAVADRVWAALGPDVMNYVEPFCGSCAVLLLRPGGSGHIETVNDADGLLANFWRALKHNSDAVAEAADNPVNEADLHARHLWLVGERERITERLMGDPEFYDAKAAGWWAWGQAAWIGSGWCSGNGPWISENGELVLRNPGQGVNRQLPEQDSDDANCRTCATPEKASTANGECAARSEWLRAYLAGFADRLRNVRVCCGDWKRVCGPSVTFRHGPTGVFLDPPYADTATRTKGLYAKDCEQVAHDVRAWAIEQGKNPLMRIVLAGYQGEHDMPSDWRVEEWEAVGGYGLIAHDETATGRVNKGRERLWLSPACCDVTDTQRMLFD